MTEAVTTVQEYTRLAIQRYRGELALDDRPRLEALEDELRDLIEGAHPAPRKIAAPSASSGGVLEKVGAAKIEVKRSSAAASVDAKIGVVAASQAAGPSASAEKDARRANVLRDAVDRAARAPVSGKDQKKIQELSRSSLHTSGYTPPSRPIWLDDYYSLPTGVIINFSAGERPAAVLTTEEGSELDPERRMLFGVGRTGARPAPARTSDPPAAPAASPPRPSPPSSPSPGPATAAVRAAPEAVKEARPTPAAAPSTQRGPQTADLVGLADDLGVEPEGPPPDPGAFDDFDFPPPQPPKPAAAPPPPKPAAAPPPPKPAAAPQVRAAPAKPASEPPDRTAPLAPPPPQEPATPKGSPVVEKAPSPAVPKASPAPKKFRPNALIHMLDGGIKKAQIDDFDPSAGFLYACLPESPSETTQIDLVDVMAIFFGTRPDVAPLEAKGERLVVRLVNDKQIGGLSPDYAPGVAAMTLVPDPRKANIDWVWVPAWSVKEIELS